MSEAFESIMRGLQELADLELDDLRHGNIERAKQDFETYEKFKEFIALQIEVRKDLLQERKQKMSMYVEDGIYVKTNCIGEPEVIIGSSFMSMETFCNIVKYVLINTDLKGNEDPRIELVSSIQSDCDVVPGFNKGAFRYEF